MRIRISWRKTVILGFISALALFILFKTTTGVREFSAILRHINQKYFWLSFATIVPSVALNAIRWYFVLRASGFSVPFKRVFVIVTSSMSLSVLPGRLGDLARSYPLRATVPPAQSIGTIVLEKVIDVCVLLGYATLGLTLLGSYPTALLTLAIALFAIPALHLIHRFGRSWVAIGGMREKIYAASSILPETRKNKLAFGAAVTASIANWGLSMIQVHLLFRAVQALVPMAAVIAYLPLSIFVGLLPITLAGVGTRDAALIYFFKSFTLPSQTLLIGILYSFQSYWILATLALPLLYFFFRESRLTDQTE